jgi:DNA-binding MarR family transcriptional regulator
LSTKVNINSSEAILIALRRVIRAVDLHSRRLSQTHGLTGPQALTLKAIIEHGQLSAGDLARELSLSQATITDIVKRLEARNLLKRNRDDDDKRRVMITATMEGLKIHSLAPPLLQETFLQRFQQLKDWEQNQLLSSMQKIAELMDAESLDAAPLLTSGSELTANDSA